MKAIDVVLVIFQFVICVTSEQKCFSSYTQPGFKLHGLVVKTIRISSLQACKEKCLTERNCRSVNLNQLQKKCELNSGNHLTSPEHLLPTDGYVYVDTGRVNQSGTTYCSNRYCSNSLQCVAKENGKYDCLTCRQVKGTEVLLFPRQAVEDKIEWREPFATTLSAFTISVWVQMSPSANFHSVFSYAYPLQANAICIHVVSKSSLNFFILNTHRVISIALIDGFWHHIAVTWKSSDGIWKIFFNGTLRQSGTLKVGKTIPKGAVLVGQDADNWLGGYSASQALKGSVTMVNMWDSDLPSGTVAEIFSKKCDSSQGNIVKWDELSSRKFGLVSSSCSRIFCS